MCSITDINEYKKRKQLPQFHDMDELQSQRELALEKHLECLERLNKKLEEILR